MHRALASARLWARRRRDGRKYGDDWMRWFQSDDAALYDDWLLARRSAGSPWRRRHELAQQVRCVHARYELNCSRTPHALANWFVVPRHASSDEMGTNTSPGLWRCRLRWRRWSRRRRRSISASIKLRCSASGPETDTFALHVKTCSTNIRICFQRLVSNPVWPNW